MAQQPISTSSTSTTGGVGVLYPQLESSIDSLNEDPKYKEIIKIEKELAAKLREVARASNLVEDVSDYNILPIELTTTAVKKPKARSKEDVIKKISELPNEDAEEEEQDDEEGASDEEQETAADEEEDEAGGDYILNHFDNGEGFEDNDDEGDDGTAGIALCYWYFGIVQEKITRTRHDPGQEKFTCTMTLVLLQCIFNALFAKLILSTIMKQGVDRTKSSYYGLSSLTYLTAMVASNMALQHVNYPTQVVGKSCKPIPIMIMGVLIGRKRYSLKKYLFVGLIVLGVALFMYKKDILELYKPASTNHSNGIISDVLSAIGIGELLLLLSLSMDGFTGAIQERMKTEHQTKSGHMMYKINLWSTFYLLASTLATGELIKFFHFIQRHPTLVYDIALFSSLSAIGQLFIFLTVAEFGPLPCSIVTTTRKFFTVLTSVFLYGNKLTPTQWMGSSLVFLGLAFDAVYGKGNHNQAQTVSKQKATKQKKS